MTHHWGKVLVNFLDDHDHDWDDDEDETGEHAAPCGDPMYQSMRATASAPEALSASFHQSCARESDGSRMIWPGHVFQMLSQGNVGSYSDSADDWSWWCDTYSTHAWEHTDCAHTCDTSYWRYLSPASESSLCHGSKRDTEMISWISFILVSQLAWWGFDANL